MPCHGSVTLINRTEIACLTVGSRSGWIQLIKIEGKGEYGKRIQKGGEIMTVEEVLLTGTEVAQRLRISRAKVYLLIQRGEIPAVKMGRNVRVRQQDIEEYVRRCLQNPFGKVQ